MRKLRLAIRYTILFLVVNAFIRGFKLDKAAGKSVCFVQLQATDGLERGQIENGWGMCIWRDMNQYTVCGEFEIV